MITETAFRLQEDDTRVPKIPAHPIGYGDAKHLLEKMVGDEAQVDWRGKIDGLTYKLGTKTSQTGNWYGWQSFLY